MISYRENELVSLRQINEEYDAILWDTSALSAHLSKGRKLAIYDSSIFAGFFVGKINKYNCFIPGSVKKEYIGGRNINWLKRTKEGKLIQEFEDTDRVLYISDSPLGPKVKERARELEKKWGVNKVDWRIISWGYELSNFFYSSAIISNDINHLGRLWDTLVRKGIIYKEKVGFFPRKELDLYERFV